MKQVSEMAERGHTSRGAPKQPGSISMIFKMLADPHALRKMRTMAPDEERYVRPPRPYELPEYREGMPHCTSNEKYLRPTRYCNPREPLVIAVANELGAYELSDREFAEAAFWFVKTNFTVEFLPFDNVSDTLKRGTGTCYPLTSVWIALCRAAGIKARYKSFNMMLSDEILSAMTAFGEVGETSTNMLNRGLPEMEGEICIDDKWVVGHVPMRPEICAYSYLPITRFGEDAIGLTLQLAPKGKIKRFESLSLRFGLTVNAMMSFISATMERANIGTLEAVQRGREIIEEAGGLEAYDRKARERLKHTDLTVNVKPHTAIIFED
ncbi:MAG: transglutaminase-like domain-containing protein [Halobacteriota archaeon]